MKRVALVVGCKHYEDDLISDLKYADSDALSFAKILSERLGLKEDEIILISDSPTSSRLPTRANILKSLIALSSGKTPLEAVFFFFSGHGFQSTKGKQYLLCADSISADVEANSLSFNQILGYLEKCGARHILLFLDACRSIMSDSKSGVEVDGNSIDVNQLCPPGVVSFCSSSPGQASFESDKFQAGVFSRGLVEAFSDEMRCQTVYELDKFLVEKLPKLADSKRVVQNPFTRLEPAGIQNLILVSDQTRNKWQDFAGVGKEFWVGDVGFEVVDAEDSILCIDFGTCKSAAAIVDRNEKVQIVRDRAGRQFVSSEVRFTEDLNYVVGGAVDLQEEVRDGIVLVKRALGTDARFNIQGRSLTPEFVASLIIRSLKSRAELITGRIFRQVITAAPANFNIAQQNSLYRSFELAGLQIVRMFSEQNAALLNLYSSLSPLERDRKIVALTIDLGGGTLDVGLRKSKLMSSFLWDQ